MGILSQKGRLYGSIFIMVTILVVMMAWVNPAIDGQNGSGILKLQLSFEKTRGVDIINSWGEHGIERFKALIIFDYLYALTYSLFFISILRHLVRKRGDSTKVLFRWGSFFSLFAGTMDWIENTMEILFVNNPVDFSNNWFFVHSMVACLKWIAVFVVVYTIIRLFGKVPANNPQISP